MYNFYIYIYTYIYDIFMFFLRFTQNLSLFRRDINDTLKGPNTTANPIGDMMTLTFN